MWVLSWGCDHAEAALSRRLTSSEPPTPAILSIQSAVAYGHVGNSAAVLPLQRMGFDVWPINTVQLGHHPGYGSFPGYQVETDRLSMILGGVLDQAPLQQCAGLLTGYLGQAAVADIVVRAAGTVRTMQPDLVHLLDPVIGDDGPGVFVQHDIPLAIRDRLLPLADIITPNRFELAYLADREVATLDDAKAASTLLLQRGPNLVVATGLALAGDPDEVSLLALADDQSWLVRTPRLAKAFSGTGDAFSALFLGHYLLAPDLRTALERAASAMFSLVELTAKRGETELSLIAAQDMLTAPAIRFPAQSAR